MIRQLEFVATPQSLEKWFIDDSCTDVTLLIQQRKILKYTEVSLIIREQEQRLKKKILTNIH